MKTALAVVAAASAIMILGVSAQAQTYSATWASTDKHTPAPEWFQDAKFGVYWHWGAFAVAEYHNEWYPRDIYVNKSDPQNWHESHYGDPFTTFPYNDMLTGKNDLSGNWTQFKPVLTSQGGQFDPVEWVNIVAASGAKFAGPVAEHHDGFSMWDSKVNVWNSMAMGPKLDLLSIWAEQIRAHNISFMVALHHAYNTNGYYEYVPQQTNTTLQALFGQLPKAQSDQRWYDIAAEVIDHVQPDMIWHDFDLYKIAESQRLAYLAYYFNAGVKWGKDVVTTWKVGDSGFRTTSAVQDYEKTGPSDIVSPYWLTDLSIGSGSWCYTNTLVLYTSATIIHSLLDRISKNGNMLLNISPRAIGYIPTEQITILKEIGAYLGRYGESVYSTRAWNVYGEGSTSGGGLRFTRSKASDILYASILGWPSGGVVSIASLRSGFSLSGLTSVQLLGDTAGTYINITSYKQTSSSLQITLPQQPAASAAYVIKFTFKGTIPKGSK